MGCDIHIWVEARASENDPWQLAFPESWTCPWCHGTGISKANAYRKVDADCFLCEGAKVVNQFTERNYNLFGMLANVRNGTGFAGVRTGDGYVPISKPRGFPKDMSLGLTKHLASWDCDVDEENSEEIEYPYRLAYQGDHSDSWLLISEILEYFADGNRVSHHQGIVSMEEYKVFLEKGRPDSWSGGIGGSGVEIVDNQKARNLLENKETQEAGKYYCTLVHWTSTYAEDAGKAFLEYFIPACQKLGDPKNVRLVFNFDS
jgi:hypothetical protein